MRSAMIILVAAAVLCLTATAADSVDRYRGQERSVDDTAAVMRQNAIQLLQIENALAPIRSKSGLDSYLRTTPADQSPFNALSRGAKARFLRSLAFNENGLTSFDYGDLRAELTASQIYQIMSLFGMQHTVNEMTGVRVSSPEDKLIGETIMAPQDCTQYPSPDQCPGDHEGYYCQSPGTCTVRANSICTHNC